MAYILLLESATEICSVALAKDNELIDMFETGEGQNHARLLSVYASDLLKKNQVDAGELDAVAISRGPGSYTGLRIGVSLAKGFCYARQIPLIAVDTLGAMASFVAGNRAKFGIDQTDETLYCPMIDARRMEVYSMLTDQAGSVVKGISAEVVDETFLANELEARRVVFLGNGAAKCEKVIHSPNAVFIHGVSASASYLVEPAWKRFQEKRFEDIAYFEPLYLKDFIVTKTKKNIFQ